MALRELCSSKNNRLFDFNKTYLMQNLIQTLGLIKHSVEQQLLLLFSSS